jgi:hypothetical protein
MDPKRFEVEISFRQTVRFRVDAKDRKAAERLALERWREGEPSQAGTLECCDVLSVTAHDVPDEDRLVRDCDSAYRYLRDRELVIEALDQDAFNPTVHDAVTAEDVAVHLGWRRKDTEGAAVTDVQRAARVLDQLCAARRVVCFTRPRARAGERGEVRLYCTPQHLERLSALITSEPELTAAATV